MADYYPPIAQAVNSLEKSTEETRGAIYDLARSAMLAQLRSLTPALSELIISREQAALEQAIRRAEAKAVRRLRNGPPHQSALRPESPTSDAADLNVPSTSQDRTRQKSSIRRPEHVSPRAHMVSRSSLRPREWRKLAALTIMALLVFAMAALKGPGIIASFHNTSDGVAESAARGARGGLTKIADRIGSAPFASSNPNANALAAQKVVLYEEDQTDPAGKRFDGTLVWRTDSVSAGPGQGPEVAIRAHIEIPEQRIGVRLSLRSNDDKALSASHTFEIMFELPPNFAHGGISDIPGVLMKEAESTSGVPLAGVGVKVATNFFLISLSPVDADMQRNVQLLKERSWFDIPVVYNDGHRATLAIEKGTAGERAFSDAFAAWEQ
jgi:hypothetical protein